MKLNIKLVILGILIGTTFMDAIMATLVRIKQPFFNEANPIYIVTGSLSLLLVIKFILVFFLFMLFYEKSWYNYFKSDLVRYTWAIILVILIMGQFNGFLSGVKEFKKSREEVIDIPKEVRLEAYKQANYSGDYNPKKDNPLFAFVYSYFFMVVTFMVFKVMEKYNKTEENPINKDLLLGNLN